MLPENSSFFHFSKHVFHRFFTGFFTGFHGFFTGFSRRFMGVSAEAQREVVFRGVRRPYLPSTLGGLRPRPGPACDEESLGFDSDGLITRAVAFR